MSIVPEKSKRRQRMSGLDYLVFWAYGEFKDEAGLWEYLGKEQAIAAEQYRDRFVHIDGMEFVLSPTGSGPHGKHRRQFQLNAGGVYVGIIKPKKGDDRPQLKVEIKGNTFTQLGEKGALAQVKRMFKRLGFEYSHSKASRIDIRCDFTTFNPSDCFKLFHDLKSVVTLAKKVQPVFESCGNCQTFQVGIAHSSNVSCRIYDKLAEIQGCPRKDAIVHECILEGEVVDQLTRVEFELNRTAIRDRYKCDSVEDVLDCLQVICDDLTGAWLRFYDHEVDRTNTGRLLGDESRLHPIWKEVRAAFLEFSDNYPKRKIKEIVIGTQSKAKQKNTVVGYLAKICALEGRNPSNWTVKDLIAFIAVQFDDVGQGITGFVKRVNIERKKISKRTLEDIAAWFENQEVEQWSLFDDPQPVSGLT